MAKSPDSVLLSEYALSSANNCTVDGGDAPISAPCPLGYVQGAENDDCLLVTDVKSNMARVNDICYKRAKGIGLKLYEDRDVLNLKGLIEERKGKIREKTL